MMWEDRRKIAKLFLFVFSFSLIISAFLPMCCAEHECIGENCTICYEMNFLKGIFESLTVTLIIFVVVDELKKYRYIIKNFNWKYRLIPVLLKVKLLE